MTDNRASIIAFFVAPILPAIAFAISSPGLGGGLSADIVSLAALSTLGYFFAFFAVGLLGLPVFLILRQFSLDGPAGSAASGTLLGMVVALVLVQRPIYWSRLEWLLEIKGLVLIGGATGLAFWAVRTLVFRAGRSKS